MPPKYKFLFSLDLVASRREWCLRVVYTLGDAEHCNMGIMFDRTATHVIVDSLKNTTTLFCALAAGKWILHVKFLEDSLAEGHWLDPGDYEVGSLQGCELDPEQPNFFVNTPQRCREEVLVRMKPLLSTWKVGVLIHNYRDRRSVRWILRAGGAEVKLLNFPVRKDKKPPRVNWIFTECPSRKWLEEVEQWKIPLIPLTYLLDFLLKGAFTGSDTTSRIFGIGKDTALEKLMKGKQLQAAANVFSSKLILNLQDVKLCYYYLVAR